LVRTPACHAGGRGFESRRPRHSSRFKRCEVWHPEAAPLPDLFPRFAPLLHARHREVMSSAYCLSMLRINRSFITDVLWLGLSVTVLGYAVWLGLL
jgi:hypothetical protein